MKTMLSLAGAAAFAGALSAQCDGAPGHSLSVPNYVSIGDQLFADVTVPRGRQALVLFSSFDDKIPTPFGTLCLGAFMSIAQFTGTGDRQVFSICDLECKPELITFTGYLQVVAFNSDFTRAGFSNQDSFTVVNTLGLAQDFNVFTQRDVVFQNAKVGGGIASGDDVRLNNVDVGGDLDPDPNRDDIIAEDDLTLEDTSVPNGSVVYGDVFNDEGGNSLAIGAVRQGSVDIDFDGWFDFLGDRSHCFAQLHTNGHKRWDDRTLKLTGTDPKENIFNVSKSQWEYANILLVNTPKDSTVLINVWGDNITSNTCVLVDGDTEACNVLLHFPQATWLKFEKGSNFESTLLAPHADIWYIDSVLDGSMYVWQADGWDHCINNNPFKGCFLIRK